MKVSEMVPEIYYSGSRDFGFIGRLYEIAFNYMKTAADMVNNNLDSDEVNQNLVELLCNTLGFIVKHKYITKDLVAISSCFSKLLKYKGSIFSIEEAIKVLLTSQEIHKEFSIELSENDSSEIEVILPPETGDIVLLEDLFDYILPVGTIVTVNYSDIKRLTSTAITAESGNADILIKQNGFAEVYNKDSKPLFQKKTPTFDPNVNYYPLELSKETILDNNSIYSGTLQNRDRNDKEDEEIIVNEGE